MHESKSVPKPLSVEIVAPELGLETGERLVVSSWLVRHGETVVVGDRLLEVLADRITFDIPSPATGTLVRILAEIDEPILPGQVLGTISAADSDPDL